MANLVISNVCNLHCDYCFARDFLGDNASGTNQSFISEEAFRSRLDFLERSDIQAVRLIGGEPGLTSSELSLRDLHRVVAERRRGC